MRFLSICCLLLFVDGVNGDFCGYSEDGGDTNMGFDCPTSVDNSDETYCCGTTAFRYCCNYATSLEHGYDSSKMDWTNEVGETLGLGINVVLGIVFGIIGLVALILILTCICCCCDCCGSSKGNNTTVIHTAPPAYPSAVSSV